MEFSLTGKDMKKKVAKKAGDSASRVYLPVDWTGKKVAVILLEEDKDE